jgi:hypothetical protein
MAGIQRRRNVINGIIDFINSFIRGVNNLIGGASDLLGAVGISIDFRVGEIPHLATGGIVNGPTMAMLGEGGRKEAVLPLEQNTGWMDDLASKINENSNGQPMTLIINLGGKKLIETVIDGINDKAMETNSQILNI